jgi:hypothetical protein
MDTPPNSPTPDYEIQPKSDYGTLGPGADVKLDSGGGVQPAADRRSRGLFGNITVRVAANPATRQPLPQQPIQAVRMAAIMAGMMLAIAGIIATQIAKNVHPRNGARFGSTVRNRYDSAAQKEAEDLLGRVARNDSAAITQVETRAASWRGRIHLTPQLTSLVTAGLNARDLSSRAATIQADLAAMNVVADDATVDQMARQAESTDHPTRIWAIWNLGLLANRGIRTDHIVALLEAHLTDNDVESRHWAAEALSYTGSDAGIPPLLKTMHDDPSPMVRERAACGLAESGMFTPKQRRTVVPTLMLYIDETGLDAATRAWSYHALRDITGQNLPDDSAAWRRWYESQR